MSTYTVRTIADGEHYFEPRTFESTAMADAFYDSTVSRINREDDPEIEVTVSVIDDASGDVMFERTFPRYVPGGVSDVARQALAWRDAL